METLLKKFGTLCLIATMFVACKDANSQQQKEAVVKQEQKEVAEVVQQQQPDESFFDAAADYMMLDNHDIYACLSDY